MGKTKSNEKPLTLEEFQKKMNELKPKTNVSKTNKPKKQ